MDITSCPEGFQHGLILRKCRHQSQFNLGIIGRKQDVILVSRHECLSDFSPTSRTDWDILQVGVDRRETTCCCYKLVVSSMNPSRLGVDHGRQRVHISRLQLHHLSMLENGLCDFMFVGQLTQDLFACGILPSLGFFCLGVQFQFFKKYFPKLLGRSQIKPYSCQFVHALFDFLAFLFQGYRQLCQAPRIDPNPFKFHVRQHWNQWVFYLFHELFQTIRK